jgi:hypothetical protein
MLYFNVIARFISKRKHIRYSNVNEKGWRVRTVVSNATFNNISAISWGSGLLVEDAFDVNKT